MNEELGREYYLTAAGLKSPPRLQAIYERYRDLVSEEAVERARESGSAALLEWVVNLRVGRAVAEIEERQLIWEQGAELSLDGRSIPYLRAPIELANSPDRALRRKIDEARVSLGARHLNSLRRERFTLEHETVSAVLGGEYVQALSELAGIGLTELGQQAAEMLRRTDDLYEQGLAVLAREKLGLGIDELERSDAAWLFRAERYDDHFPAARLVATAAAQMGDMGLDASRNGRVRVDAAEREGKQPRAFCVPVRVPEEVYLVIRPRGGHIDYRTFWHELGHAMHFAVVSPTLPFEARWLGDNSVTEGFAMLWDHLTLRRDWLVRYAGLNPKDARRFVFELGVNELYLLRRYAAKLLYELDFHGSGFERMERVYALRLTDATRFRYPEEDYLNDVDPSFYAARYLRAWQLEAVFSTLLAERFGPEWYRRREAGALVNQWMRRGQARPADVLAEEVGGMQLGFERVVSRLVADFEL